MAEVPQVRSRQQTTRGQGRTGASEETIRNLETRGPLAEATDITERICASVFGGFLKL